MTTETLAEAIDNSILDAVEATDSILSANGIQIDESIATPEDYVEVLASILDENDLAEDVEEALCLSVALIESLMDEANALVESEDVDEDEDGLDEGKMKPERRKAMQASKQHTRDMLGFRRVALDMGAPRVGHAVVTPGKKTAPEILKVLRGLNIRGRKGLSTDVAHQHFAGVDEKGEPLAMGSGRVRNYGPGLHYDPLAAKKPGKYAKKLSDKLAALSKQAKAAGADEAPTDKMAKEA